MNERLRAQARGVSDVQILLFVTFNGASFSHILKQHGRRKHKELWCGDSIEWSRKDHYTIGPIAPKPLCEGCESKLSNS
jgi:hypothetical protein